MRRLAPDFFNRRFDDLLEAGRSRLPSLAPRWTDYNAHDPGITLMELLAWVSEAQLYSLARMRRDERAGYAALLGVRATGPAPAHGSLWPQRSDPDSPFVGFQQAMVLEPESVVRTTNSETPAFHPTQRILWTPGRVVALRTRLADGQRVDQTRTNEHGDRAFEPFGPAAGPGDVLRLEFASNGDRGLFPSRRELAQGAAWPIGVRVDAPAAGAANDASPRLGPAALAVTLRAGTERIELPVIEDGTRGFMQSGVLLLDVSQVPDSPAVFSVEISAVRGFARPPRILRIEPGVLPIVQGGVIKNEAHAALGLPSQRLRLAQPGLRFGAGVSPLAVVTVEQGARHAWRRVDDLASSGPADRDYQLDTADESLLFGNGVNGFLPPFESQIFIDYPYCDGVGANTPRNQHWMVRGIVGVFGVNPEAIDGGSDANSDSDLRREARRRLRESHALVTAGDIEVAALGLADLEVARAKVPAIKPQTDAQREIALLVMRARAMPEEPAQPPETARWLAAVRNALLPRMPLGTRLLVRAPGYRAFSLHASVEVLPRRDPDEIATAVTNKLRDAFTLVPRPHHTPRDFGAPVSARDLAAMIRAVPGVRRIVALTMSADGQDVKQLLLKRVELPRLDLVASRIDAVRASPGGTR
ncbi:putative baseplate assembly protein [Variovorax sp. J31P179]|uniref:putative baseplate assembly protein n=1 Tax=Variovorax sp. J31P179 TaxID=3053508 RepID=UPI002574DEBC|nr:putative baseplate assembly protein [Variovorax sp. J31P179]MDM0085094.1 putative baseplate assembly protein [Variovorax sp. J31P179]